MPQAHQIDASDVLAVRDLNIAFQQEQHAVQAVKDLSFTLKRGETLAIVGESGSGKSVTALALMRLLEQSGGAVNSEAILLRRRNREVIEVTEQSASQMRHVRGADIAMIFQEPMTSLNPVFTVGEQIAESIRLHQGLGRDEALKAAKKMLDQVRIPEAETILKRYPHQLSGGMRQRVMIAMALSCRPAVLIADEPTTALDVTIQAQILQLIAVLQKEMEMGVIFITHDMGVVADVADRVLVMYQGEAVETGSVEQIFSAPEHPYTQALLAAVPTLGEMSGSDLPRRFLAECARGERGAGHGHFRRADITGPRSGHPLPAAQRLAQPRDPRSARSGKGEFRSLAWRNAGVGGRVRIREVDDRARAAAPGRIAKRQHHL